jgi:hypothetical protein
MAIATTDTDPEKFTHLQYLYTSARTLAVNFFGTEGLLFKEFVLLEMVPKQVPVLVFLEHFEFECSHKNKRHRYPYSIATSMLYNCAQQCCGSGSGAFLPPGSGIRDAFIPDPGYDLFLYKENLLIAFIQQ